MHHQVGALRGSAFKSVNTAISRFRLFKRMKSGGVPVMKILRFLLIASAVGLSGGLSSTSQSVAQTPASPEMLQAAKELVSLVSASLVSDMTTKITAQVWPPMESALRAQNSKLD